MPFVDDIEVEAAPLCPSCGAAGDFLYPRLRDHTFGAPGEWGMRCCSACALLWLDPRPTVADIGKVYRSYYTHGVSGAGSTFQAHVRDSGLTRRLLRTVTGSVRRVQDAVLAVRFGYRHMSKGSLDTFLTWTLGLLPGMTQGASIQVLGLHARETGRILDIGCGNGTFLARLRDLGWDAVGQETDPVAARFARERFGLDVREGLLGMAGLAAESFDVVTLSHVIEHVHVPEDFVRECSTLLKPGGKLIVLTPNTEGLGHRCFRDAWRGLEPPRHLQCFSSATLRACLERAGMQVETVATLSRMMRAIWYTSRLIRRAERGGRTKNNVLDYLAAYGMQLLESVVCRIRPHTGEEIMLIARRPLSPQDSPRPRP